MIYIIYIQRFRPTSVHLKPKFDLIYFNLYNWHLYLLIHLLYVLYSASIRHVGISAIEKHNYFTNICVLFCCVVFPVTSQYFLATYNYFYNHFPHFSTFQCFPVTYHYHLLYQYFYMFKISVVFSKYFSVFPIYLYSLFSVFSDIYASETFLSMFHRHLSEFFHHPNACTVWHPSHTAGNGPPTTLLKEKTGMARW